MTFENSISMTALMNEQGIGAICMAASLDGILNHHNVPDEFYRQSSAIYGIEGDEPLVLREKIATTLLYPAGNYFGEFGNVASYSVGEQEAVSPLSSEGKDELSCPRPEHLHLQASLDLLEEQIRADESGEIPADIVRLDVRQRITLAIVIDNALRQNLTVMAWQGEKHIFGIIKDNKDAYYIVNTSVNNDKVTEITKTGPLTLEEVVGLHPANRPSHWHQNTEPFFSPFDYVCIDDE